jgi:hypothetical protein
MIYETASSAGFWKYLGCKYQVENPAGHTMDPGIVRFIRTFDPDFEHLWCIHSYKTPGGKHETHAYHAIGRHIQQTVSGGDPGPSVDVALPPERARRGPVYIARVLHGPQRPNQAPPAFVPFTMKDAKNMETWYAAFRKRVHGENKTRDEILSEKTPAEIELEKTIAEVEQSVVDDSRIIFNAIDNGRFWDKPWEPKPFVHVRAASPAA